MQKTIFKAAAVLATLLMVAGLAAAADEFVLRPKYPNVKPISTDELARVYDQAVIVDVRSDIEYDVAHITKAVHISISQGTFIGELEKARAKESASPLAFYCNGTTCAKSYKAAEEAMAAGFANVFCYDAGVNAWITTHPEKGTLMGRTPAVKEKLLSDEAFSARKIGYAEFAKKASEANSLVIDIREPFQRAKDPQLPQNKMLTLSGVRNIPSDRLVPLLKKGEFKDNQLLITDAVGKQVQWLQYYLEDNGYKNYFFLDNGVLSAAKAGAVK
ncbi:putative sulfurtransferase [Desulfuromonas soudanensis]|uniref:Putative sulfurtransferase n=1 Tax=Desulfuromonas soudanensis TaxID=1603606 RepID=A0A0M5IRT8_9BACT|nr:rhodanese-like domain-containing protein [Desulfuromonas soudanensis]ALC17086.1 putative sulfurtransferase [Desulfuromonas soudanensis]